MAVSAIGETAMDPRFSKWELDDIKVRERGRTILVSIYIYIYIYMYDN